MVFLKSQPTLKLWYGKPPVAKAMEGKGGKDEEMGV
jgi:hypothetical protein